MPVPARLPVAPFSAILPALLPLLWLGACAGTGPTTHHDAVPWAAPSLDRTAFPVDTATGATLSVDALFDRLADADVVFLGETHLDEETHRFEHAVYEALVERTGGRVVLAMEMFERDVQPALDDYLAGRIDETAFLAASRPWGNYPTAYRRLVESARRHGLPVVASNAPRPLIREIGGTQEGLEALAPEQRALFPAEIHDNSAEYWRRVDNAVRGHAGMMGGGGERRFSTQALWDNSMGDACATALASHPGWVVLHVNGGFHSSYGQGTVHQLRLRAPDADVLTVAIDPTTNPGGARADGRNDADFVVFVLPRARDVDGGLHGVTLTRELRYRLHVPKSATDDAPVPLLVWLGDDDRTPADGLALWRDRLGDSCAIAVPEPLWSGRADDLVEGGRWMRSGESMTDIGAAASAVREIWGYISRNLPVDGRRVVVAGEGSGGTVAAASAVFAGAMPASAVAIAPRGGQVLKNFSLPIDPEDADAPTSGRTLDVLSDDASWDGELAQYASVGLDARRSTTDTDPWTEDAEIESLLRERLGLAPRAASAAPRAHVRVPADTPRARTWGRLVALRRAADRGGPVAVLGPNDPAPADSEALSLDISPATFTPPGRLPRAPGPFGGTTVLVLPEDLDPSIRAAWIALEDDDPLTAVSRFHRLRIATHGGERPLEGVLDKLTEEGRNNVLVVPAVFCADAATMRALHDKAGGRDEMTLHFRPGLGDRLARAKPHP